MSEPVSQIIDSDQPQVTSYAQPTVGELEAQLTAAREEEAKVAAAQAEKSILEQLHEVTHGDEKVTFLDAVRTVAGRLSEAGKLVESDLIQGAESPQVHAVLLKAVGELIERVV